MTESAQLPPKGIGSDDPRMRCSFTIMAGVAVLASAGGCHRKEAGICRTSPPERSVDYQRWADAVSAARCKHFRLEAAPAGGQATAPNVS